MDLSPAEVLTRLDEIDIQLGALQNAYENVSDELESLEGEWKRRATLAYLATDKSNTVAEREAAAFRAAVETDDLYDRLVAARAGKVKARATFDVLRERASINQSVLRAQREEAFTLSRRAA